MSVNPNWPLVLDEYNPSQGFNGGEQPTSTWTDLTRRSRNQQSLTRGRQYELDETRAGTLTGTWANPDGALDPTNANSPFAPGVLPYRPWRKRCQWPPTPNLLTADQATGGEGTPLTPGTLASTAGVESAYDPNAQVATSATAWQGTQVWQMVYPTGQPTGHGLIGCYTSIAATGLPYSFQARARCITTGQAIQAAAAIGWVTSSGALLSTSSGSTATLTGGTSAAWSTLTCAATVPAGAVSAVVYIDALSTPTAAATVQVDGLQFEQAGAPSGFQVPGTWYPQYTGWVERYPQSWSLSGTYGLVQPSIVDTFAILSQTILMAPFPSQVMQYAPVSFCYTFGDYYTLGSSFLGDSYTLEDSATQPTFTDLAGVRAQAAVVSSIQGAGTITPATQITSSSPQGGFLGNGANAVCVDLAQPVTAGSGPQPVACSGLSVPPSPTGVIGTAGGGVSVACGWTRCLAFMLTQTPAINTSAVLNAIASGNDQNDFQLAVVNNGTSSNPNLQVWFSVILDDTTAAEVFWPTAIDEGDWHFACWGVSSDGRTASLSVDGGTPVTASIETIQQTIGGVIVDFSLADIAPMALDYVAVTASAARPYALTLPFAGDLASLAEWPALLDAAQIADLYQAWRTAFTGDTSGQRYARILGWAGYSGPTAIDTGSTVDMGPATDIYQGTLYQGGTLQGGLDALTALQQVVQTENGNHYVDRDGTVVFEGRSARYNQLTPMFVFGEDIAAGEYPYEDVQFDFDTTLLVTRAQITQYSTQQIYQWPPAGSASQSQYGMFTLQRTINSDDPNECVAAAQYLVSQHQDPHLRVQSIRLHPSGTTALWPVCLSLELGTRVRVMRRPTGAPVVQFDGFVEKITVSWDNAAQCVYTLQLSSADLTQYWLLAAMHTTLQQPLVAGSSTQVVLNPLPDAAVNYPISSWPHTVENGYWEPTTTYVVDPGTPMEETLSMGPGIEWSGGSGSNLYGSWTLYLATPPAHNHAAGAVFCEALPAGSTDPTTWDSASQLGATTTLAY